MMSVRARRDALDRAICEEAATEPWAPVVGRLACLRGVSTLAAFALGRRSASGSASTDARSASRTTGSAPASAPDDLGARLRPGGGLTQSDRLIGGVAPYNTTKWACFHDGSPVPTNLDFSTSTVEGGLLSRGYGGACGNVSWTTAQ